ncbi:MAG: hypothetical protein ACYSR6_01615 [Planctomycetota bacterium]|jgi:hypothetical protein
MSTFWLKAAGVVVVVVGSIIVVLALLPSGNEPTPEPQPGQKTFYDVTQEDREKFLTEPKPANSVDQKPPTPTYEPNESTGVAQHTPKPPETVTLYFSELSEIEKIEAERLLQVAVPGRSIGRLPTTGFNLMVQTCRQIIQRWPDSWYAYRAKQMLADMPERFRPRYRITEEELDLSRFAEPRPGTKPFVVEKSD